MLASSGKYLLACSFLIVTIACSLVTPSISKPTTGPNLVDKNTPSESSTTTPTDTPTQTNGLPAPVEADEQAIFASFLTDFSGTTALVREETFGDTYTQNEQETIAYIKSNLAGISDETLSNYLAVNLVSSQLPANLDLKVQYLLLSTPDFIKITSEPNWGEVLKEKYPGSQGCISFSRVGFNQAHTQALIYVTRISGPLAGGGGYYLLEAQAGKWKIIAQFVNVIS